MAYKNTSTLSYEVERQLAGDYNINAHGDLGAFYDSISNAHLPRYTAMFYHQSEHEMITEFKYDRLQIGYDSGMRKTRDALQGTPLEAYIPASVVMPDGVGKNGFREVMPVALSAIEEIANAQDNVLGSKASGRVEKLFLIEAVEEIQVRRHFRRIEIGLKEMRPEPDKISRTP